MSRVIQGADKVRNRFPWIQCITGKRHSHFRISSLHNNIPVFKVAIKWEVCIIDYECKITSAWINGIFVYKPLDKVLKERLNCFTVTVMKVNVQIGKLSDLKKAKHSALSIIV